SLGSGRSDSLPAGRAFTVDRKISEAIAVMDAAGAERAFVVAWFSAVPGALALAPPHPNRGRGLVAVHGLAPLAGDVGFPNGVPRSVRDGFERTVAEEYGRGRMVERWLPEVSHHPEVRAFMERYEQALSKRGDITHASEFVTSLDVRDRLHAIDVPVTIVH